MNEWSNLEEFEEVVWEELQEAERPLRTLPPPIAPPAEQPARQISYDTPTRAGKQARMSNDKTYEIHFANGDVGTIQANSVEETGTRVRFLGNVEGATSSYNSDVIESLRAEIVDSYRLLPTAEKEARIEGQNVYRVNMVDGSHKDVRADLVMHAPGQEGAGRYTLATRLSVSNTRTEYVVPEGEVFSIERVVPGADAKGVDVSDGKGAPAKADAIVKKG